MLSGIAWLISQRQTYLHGLEIVEENPLMLSLKRGESPYQVAYTFDTLLTQGQKEISLPANLLGSIFFSRVAEKETITYSPIKPQYQQYIRLCFDYWAIVSNGLLEFVEANEYTPKPGSVLVNSLGSSQLLTRTESSGQRMPLLAVPLLFEESTNKAEKYLSLSLTDEVFSNSTENLCGTSLKQPSCAIHHIFVLISYMLGIQAPSRIATKTFKTLPSSLIQTVEIEKLNNNKLTEKYSDRLHPDNILETARQRLFPWDANAIAERLGPPMFSINNLSITTYNAAENFFFQFVFIASLVATSTYLSQKIAQQYQNPKRAPNRLQRFVNRHPDTCQQILNLGLLTLGSMLFVSPLVSAASAVAYLVTMYIASGVKHYFDQQDNTRQQRRGNRKTKRPTTQETLLNHYKRDRWGVIATTGVFWFMVQQNLYNNFTALFFAVIAGASAYLGFRPPNTIEVTHKAKRP